MKLLGSAGKSSFSLSLDLTPPNCSLQLHLLGASAFPPAKNKQTRKAKESEVDSSNDDGFSGEVDEDESCSDEDGPGPENGATTNP